MVAKKNKKLQTKDKLKDNTLEKIKKVILSIAIAIVFTFFIGVGAEVFFPTPEYRDFCNDSIIKPKTLDSRNSINETACQEAGGKWHEYDSTIPSSKQNNKLECSQLSKDGDNIVLSCENISSSSPNGYCEHDFYCRQDYENAREKHSRAVFVIALLFGLIGLLLGIYLSIASVSAGLMAGGVLLMFYGTIKYWEYSTQMFKFLFLGAVFVVLLWIAYKKLNK